MGGRTGIAAGWIFYFVAKLYLAWRGFVDPIVWQNVLLFAFVALPVPMGWRYRTAIVVAKNVIAVACAILSLWADSWLPPLSEAMSFLADPATRPSLDYILGFVAHYFDFDSATLMALAAALFASFLLAMRPATASAAVIASLVGIQSMEMARAPVAPDARLQSFFDAESKRLVSFGVPAPGDAPFDIVFLHICSLSWDDLTYAGMGEPALFKQFQYWWTDFNSVTGYSEIAAYRLFRSNCGQEIHDALYEDAPPQCYLLDSLRKLGYRTATVFNHTGEYDDMKTTIVDLGHADEMAPVEGLPVVRMNFDNTPIFSDYAALERWWQGRQASGAERAAVYYDTITLHDGAHRLDDHTWWTLPRGPDVYRDAADELFDDVGRFLELLEHSGRNVVVVFLPEHGRALRPTKIQAAQLRDIPLPEITRVPVGIKLIGPGWPEGSTTSIATPVSYQAIAYMLSRFVAEPPFGAGARTVAGVMRGLPATDFVSENDPDVRVFGDGSEFYFYGKRHRWTLLPPMGGGTVGAHTR
jgi:cellulose synthase operon protein YhjU